MHGVTLAAVQAAIRQLEHDGQKPTANAVHKRLGGNRAAVQRFFKEAQGTARLELPGASQEGTATAVLEASRVPDPVPDTLQAITDAEAALEAAKAHVEALKQQHAPALRMNGLLVAAWQERRITRDDTAWYDFDQASAQIFEAEKVVPQAEKAVKYARYAHDLHCYELAAAVVAQTPEGQALLAKIDDYQRQREAADEKGSPAAFSWGIIKAKAQQEFRNLVNVHRGLVKPKTPPVTEEQRQQGMAGAVMEMQRDNPARDPIRYNPYR